MVAGNGVGCDVEGSAATHGAVVEGNLEVEIRF